MFRFEYFLSDYIFKIANFDEDYLGSAFNNEGYYDMYNYGKTVLKPATAEAVRTRRRADIRKEGTSYVYEFCITPTIGFLSSPLPLYKDCEIKLSFDRAKAATSVVEVVDGGVLPDYFTIKNVFAETEYVSSPALRSYFEKIDRAPLVYKFEEIEIIVKSLPNDETNIRLDNIYGGNTPNYLFAGIIPTANLAGTKESCSTYFSQNGVTEFNLTLNGSSVNGFPLHSPNKSCIFPLTKFLDTTGKMYRLGVGKTLSTIDFKCSYLWSHRFEAEETTSGWLGVELKAENVISTASSIVIFMIKSSAITIDKFRSIEKLQL